MFFDIALLGPLRGSFLFLGRDTDSMRIAAALPRSLVCACVLCWAASGLDLSAQEKLIAEGEGIKYFKGTEDPPAQWVQPDFDDSGWLDGQTPIGYSSDLTYNTTLADMQKTPTQAGYLTFYTRKKFNIADVNAVKSLKISFKYDDGFIAYINGVEVLRKNLPPGPVNKDTPGQEHETNSDFEDSSFDCDKLASANLKSGENLFAVEIHNTTTESSDCSLSFEVATVTAVCPINFICELNTRNQVILRWKRPVVITYSALALFRNDVKIEPGPSKGATSFADIDPLQGLNKYRLVATVCGVDCSLADQPTCSVEVGQGSGDKFRRGDADDNGAVNLTDAVRLLGHLFQGGTAPSCPDAADMDDDAALKITDAVYLLASLFRGGAAPPPPGVEACGADPTQDELGACTYTNCK